MNELSAAQFQGNGSEIFHRTMQNSEAENAALISPSRESYGALIYLFDYLNEQLFNRTLPPCIITMPRSRRPQRGYFCGESWGKANQGVMCDEIALNPIHFQGSSTEQTFSTLVHEMVHQFQAYNGTPGKGAYHNKEWGELMRQVGLIPSSTAKPGGKETGRSVSHYIEEGGAFQRVCQKLLDTGFVIPWHAITPQDSDDDDNSGDDDDVDGDNAAKKKRASKTKYTCPGCTLNAWAKPDVCILCGTCHQELMVAGS